MKLKRFNENDFGFEDLSGVSDVYDRLEGHEMTYWKVRKVTDFSMTEPLRKFYEEFHDLIDAGKLIIFYDDQNESQTRVYINETESDTLLLCELPDTDYNKTWIS